MNKIALLLLTIVFICSCSTEQINNKSNVTEITNNIVYFKDYKTGLCFASVNSITSNLYTVASITCVPCDSLKNLKFKDGK